MTIRPDKRNYVWFIICLATVGFFLFPDISSVITGSETGLRPGAIWGLVFAFLFACGTFYLGMMFCKTVQLDQDGVTVSVLWFRKRFSWSDFGTKRVGLYYPVMKLGIGRRGKMFPLYSKGMVFSTRASKFRKLWPNHSVYSWYSFFRPLHTFFVFFDVRDEYRENLYYADENYFLRLLKQWGVTWETVEYGYIGSFFKKIKLKAKK